jgi:hypothetical protein
MTLCEKTVEFLLGKGLVEAVSPSRKYRKFLSKTGSCYWLGKKGALRVGDTSSESRSVTHLVKEKIA